MGHQQAVRMASLAQGAGLLRGFRWGSPRTVRGIVWGLGRSAKRTILSRASAGALLTLSKAELEVNARAVCAPRLQCVRGVSKDANDVMLQGSGSGCVPLQLAGSL